MATTESSSPRKRTVSTLTARESFGRLLDRIDTEQCSVVIEKRGTPRAVLLSLRDYVRLAAPEPEVLRLIGEDSIRNKTNELTSRQIDAVIKSAPVGRKLR